MADHRNYVYGKWPHLEASAVIPGTTARSSFASRGMKGLGCSGVAGVTGRCCRHTAWAGVATGFVTRSESLHFSKAVSASIREIGSTLRMHWSLGQRLAWRAAECGVQNTALRTAVFTRALAARLRPSSLPD